MRLPVMITVLSERVAPETTSITDTCVIAIARCLLPVQAPAARSTIAVIARARNGTADRFARNGEFRQSLRTTARVAGAHAARQMPLDIARASRLLQRGNSHGSPTSSERAHPREESHQAGQGSAGRERCVEG